jgi:hypothetical protein
MDGVARRYLTLDLSVRCWYVKISSEYREIEKRLKLNIYIFESFA